MDHKLRIHLMFASSTFPPKKLPEGHYLYIHRAITDGKIFYVGKGQGNRAWKHEGRTNDWWLKKCANGHRVEIMMENISCDQIDNLERATILIFQFMGHPLVNKKLINKPRRKTWRELLLENNHFLRN